MSRKLGTSTTSLQACDTCGVVARAVYCHANSAFLCPNCDVTVKVGSRYGQVRTCDVCARVPAVFVCKADAASLCSSCDAKIHSANPLAGRHERVSIIPIGEQNRGFDDDDDVAEAASWLVLNPEKNGEELLFGGKVDEYLELVEDCNSSGETENGFGDVHFVDYSVHRGSYEVDSVVSVQNEMEQEQIQRFQPATVHFDFSKPPFPSTISQTVSISSKEVSIVPESTVSEVSISDSNSAIGTSNLTSGPPILMPSYLTYREARVLRYREKKKTRKFEKKIRYASRKAYAEVRPRIKGRFAKINDVEPEMDHMFSSTLITEAGCNVVPSL